VLTGVRVVWGITGSHHNIQRYLNRMKEVVAAGLDVLPVLSWSVSNESTRFGDPAQWLARLSSITAHQALLTIPDVEPLGPMKAMDVTVVAPCTGNTLARIAHGLTDSPVLMAVKATLRSNRPVVLAISSNDILGLNAPNLAILLATRNVYFVPFGQDNPAEKPYSVDSDDALLLPTIEAALAGRQLQPLLLGPRA